MHDKLDSRGAAADAAPTTATAVRYGWMEGRLLVLGGGLAIIAIVVCWLLGVPQIGRLLAGASVLLGTAFLLLGRRAELTPVGARGEVSRFLLEILEQPPPPGSFPQGRRTVLPWSAIAGLERIVHRDGEGEQAWAVRLIGRADTGDEDRVLLRLGHLDEDGPVLPHRLRSRAAGLVVLTGLPALT